MSQPGPDTSSIESVLKEGRVFEPPASFSERVGGTYISSMEEYRKLYERSIRDPEAFWAEVAAQFDWFKPWETVLEWDLPDAKWFVGGRTNICHNCVDRQVNGGHGDETAIIWEGEPLEGGEPEVRRYTYRELQREISRFANVLKGRGVKKGDVVTIYMGMVPELAIAMLACARIGAPHSIIFGGFSSQAIADRVIDADSRTIVTCDGAWRRGKVVPLKENVDDACNQLEKSGNPVENVIVVKRCRNEIQWTDGRDHWWHELEKSVDDECPCEEMDSEDMLFLLYTSGSTGKPKGIMHTTAGYMVYTAITARYVFNLVPNQNQVYWCTADIGWVTGHSYIIYGVLPNRVPTLMYEGAPNAPDESRFWSIVERHKVTQFYTAPTAIRAFMKWGREHADKHDLSSLRVLGTVGEPINPEAWMWYHKVIGHEKCPIVDTWWQTETGGHLITPLPGATPTTPGSCTLPFFGIDAAIVNEKGEEVPHGTGGLLAIRKPWPAILRGVYGDRQRLIDTYFSRIEGMYFPGDGAKRDERGYFWIMGRVDDVINVSGHRLGTMEIESAVVGVEGIAEAAVVGGDHEVKGEAVYVYAISEDGYETGDELEERVMQGVLDSIGPIAKPEEIIFTPELPKTRSGKIMRRLLENIASGDELGNTSTLRNPEVVDEIAEQVDID